MKGNVSVAVKTEKNTPDSSTFPGTGHHFINSIYCISNRRYIYHQWIPVEWYFSR